MIIIDTIGIISSFIIGYIIKDIKGGILLSFLYFYLKE